MREIDSQRVICDARFLMGTNQVLCPMIYLTEEVTDILISCFCESIE